MLNTNKEYIKFVRETANVLLDHKYYVSLANFTTSKMIRLHQHFYGRDKYIEQLIKPYVHSGALYYDVIDTMFSLFHEMPSKDNYRNDFELQLLMRKRFEKLATLSEGTFLSSEDIFDKLVELIITQYEKSDTDVMWLEPLVEHLYSNFEDKAFEIDMLLPNELSYANMHKEMRTEDLEELDASSSEETYAFIINRIIEFIMSSGRYKNFDVVQVYLEEEVLNAQIFCSSLYNQVQFYKDIYDAVITRFKAYETGNISIMLSGKEEFLEMFERKFININISDDSTAIEIIEGDNDSNNVNSISDQDQHDSEVEENYKQFLQNISSTMMNKIEGMVLEFSLQAEKNFESQLGRAMWLNRLLNKSDVEKEITEYWLAAMHNCPISIDNRDLFRDIANSMLDSLKSFFHAKDSNSIKKKFDVLYYVLSKHSSKFDLDFDVHFFHKVLEVITYQYETYGSDGSNYIRLLDESLRLNDKFPDRYKEIKFALPYSLLGVNGNKKDDFDEYAYYDIVEDTVLYGWRNPQHTFDIIKEYIEQQANFVQKAYSYNKEKFYHDMYQFYIQEYRNEEEFRNGIKNTPYKDDFIAIFTPAQQQLSNQNEDDTVLRHEVLDTTDIQFIGGKMINEELDIS